MRVLKFFLTIFLLGNTQCDPCKTFLTVSTNEFSYFYTNLVINWGPDCEDPPKLIRIFDYNPYEFGAPHLFEFHTRAQKSGRIETDVRLNTLSLPRKWDASRNLSESLALADNQRRCLDYFIVSYNHSNHPISFDCLKIEPQWMTEMPEIWDLPLKELYIPGSHCAGCYMTRENARDRKEEGFLQNLDVWHQLVFGIRYLDISIGLYKRIDQLFYDPHDPFYEKVFWIQRENVMINPFVKIIRDVAKFVQLSKEIVIINFGEFSHDFRALPEIHEILKHVINDEVGSLAYVNRQNNRQSFSVTIREMRATGKYLLINYNHHNLSISHENNETIFWPYWKSSNGEIDAKVTDLDVVSYMKGIFSEKFRNNDDKDGWILSLDVDKFNIPNKANPRDEAEYINNKALFALGGPWSLKVNVISLDFSFATNFIDVAIYTNQLKGAAIGNLTVVDLS